jgi:hypothetical protein
MRLRRHVFRPKWRRCRRKPGVAHTDRLPGNSAAQLISPGGVESESLRGQMLPTRWLAAMPYARQILAGFGALDHLSIATWLGWPLVAVVAAAAVDNRPLS